ncbi:linear amide C-N hydrolase [Flammeovirga yaeyamensis]|uniref:Linear amide C-N hydrolase n=1 Tax=Flammeovirga yaeyamensis TaxID=367791 RepID=A0AAX1N4F1_9BACT|nr:linear amide C-N hydrolase [Flammeovirga yaeyamensis]MBB3700651.1 choloylglycine hydrolase [Flammeovirga yaeyamensis]NMF37764.1 linear amide C-N hydrolase [Flammeovirga yaeyamensis]QWG02072.1 linear amide C-N hydrolase [Flammeovirga yaeyamensis]
MKGFNYFKKVLSVLTVFIVLFSSSANACSFFKFHANGNTYIGRTMELPVELAEQIVIVPRDYNFYNLKVKYGFTGIEHGNTGLMSSGLNEHGLNIEALALFESNYAPVGEGDINQQQVVSYVLGNAKSVDEAIELLKKTKVEGSKLSLMKDIELGIHFAITDGKRSVVVEYINGKGTPEIYENKLGVMTNDPRYPTQELMAMSLINGDLESGTTTFSEENFMGFDRTPQGRFQQLVALNYTQDLTRVKTDFDAINRAWAMVNSVEIVQGSLYWRFVDEKPQMTGYSTVIDVKNKVYHFRTYDNMDIRKVDVNAIDFATVAYQTQDIYRTQSEYKDIKINNVR